VATAGLDSRKPAEGCPVPDSAREAVQMASEGCLAQPLSITVKRVAGERFEQVTKCRLGPKLAWTPKPPLIPEPGWNDLIDDPPDPELVQLRRWRRYPVLNLIKGTPMTPTKIFPLLLILLDVGAALVYAWNTDIRHAIYWLAAATLTATVTF